ncbi:uncharacterized protein LOC114689238 [Peromyscus leucopus]|uniref:uncharacterized protein LOC114689238 n=1 Tax=Peromyscus leucopus TaxID=10041 RepID=UPI001884DDF0|nr:uncharacterized protein LOC114689238 [Peromyscus leucopus]
MLQKLRLRYRKSFSVRSETSIVHVKDKACSTSDDIDDMEEYNNDDDFVMSYKDQMKTPPKEKKNPSLIKVQSRKGRCVRSVLQKLGLRHRKSFSVRSETSIVHMKDKACSTSDDLCEEHPQASEEGSKPSLVAVPSRRHRYMVAILRKLGVRCSVTSTINEMSETTLQKSCDTNDDIDDMEEYNNDDDFVMSYKDQMKTPQKEKKNPSLIKIKT